MSAFKGREAMPCPMNGKLCIDGRREDFPKDKNGTLLQCRWWTAIKGKDPQSNTDIDIHDCAVAWIPVTTLDASQSSRYAAASSDKVANVQSEMKGFMKRIAVGLRQMARGVNQVAENQKKSIENGQRPSLPASSSKDDAPF